MMLHIQKLLFPLCRHHWRLQLFRHDSNQGSALFRWKQDLCFLVSGADDKALLDQLLDRACPGCRSTQPFTLRFLRNVFRAGSFHRTKKRPFRIVLGRFCLAFFHFGIIDCEYLAFLYIRNSLFLFFGRIVMIHDRLPSGIQDLFSPYGEGFTGTSDRDRSLRKPARNSHCAQKPNRCQLQDLCFTLRQLPDLRGTYFLCRDHRMMISDFRIIDHLLRIDRNQVRILQGIGCCLCKLRQSCSHILCQIPAVCSRISDQFFLIQALQIIQCLLRRISQDLIGISLQGSQIIQERRLF